MHSGEIGVFGGGSLSARRAWIEIVTPPPVTGAVSVALRKESVDRNFGGSTASCAVGRSLSARRAWIEIFLSEYMIPVIVVALRKESVDRNYSVHIYLAGDLRVALRKESVDRNLWSWINSY